MGKRGNADVRPDYGTEVIENRVGGCLSCGVLPLTAFWITVWILE